MVAMVCHICYCQADPIICIVSCSAHTEVVTKIRDVLMPAISYHLIGPLGPATKNQK